MLLNAPIVVGFLYSGVNFHHWFKVRNLQVRLNQQSQEKAMNLYFITTEHRKVLKYLIHVRFESWPYMYLYM